MKLDGGRGAAESSKRRGETGISGVYWPAFCLRKKDQETPRKAFSVDVWPMDAQAHCHMNIYMQLTAQLIYLKKKREGLE